MPDRKGLRFDPRNERSIGWIECFTDMKLLPREETIAGMANT